jgi:hypothetical protein
LQEVNDQLQIFGSQLVGDCGDLGQFHAHFHLRHLLAPLSAPFSLAPLTAPLNYAI